MATTLSARILALELEVLQQRKLIPQQMEQLRKQQSVLDVQFRRMADIQAELDLVKATLRHAAPIIAQATGHTAIAAGAASRSHAAVSDCNVVTA
jgi:hypothetical protein